MNDCKRVQKHDNMIIEDVRTKNGRIEVQTQEYDYFGKRFSPTFPKSKEFHRKSSPHIVDNTFHNKESSPNHGLLMNNMDERRIPRYRVMNPMYRIMKEYSTLSNAAERKSSRSRPLSILIVDEGGEIRSRMAAAMLVFLLRNLQKNILVQVEVASIGPPTPDEINYISTDVLTKLVKRWMNNDEKALRIAEEVPRRFQEVKDPVEHDIILVMDRYDMQETLREVSVLDAISPGNYYSSRVKKLGLFAANSRKQGPRGPPSFLTDILDPLYFPKEASKEHILMKDGVCNKNVPEELSNESKDIQTLCRDLAYSCKGLVDMLQSIHEISSSARQNLKPRDVLQQILRCPGLWMESPYGRTGTYNICTVSKPNKYRSASRLDLHGAKFRNPIEKRNTKEKGYWKIEENVERELDIFMKRNQMTTLPTQAMLRNHGEHSLASSIDYHGGLSKFAIRLGKKLHKRRPNGFWSNRDALKDEIHQFIWDHKREGSEGAMPTAQDLQKAGRSDLVRAIRMHGGFAQVALSIGVKPHRSSHQWGEVEILTFLREMQRNGSEISRKAVRQADKIGLESAIDRLGGFPYFIKLLEDDEGSCALHFTACIKREDDIWLSDEPDCQYLNCPVPLIEKVGRKLTTWMSTRKSNNNNRRARLPTKRELEEAGRLDIWRSMQRAGGMQKMSEYLGLPYVETRGRKALHHGTVPSQNVEWNYNNKRLSESWNTHEDFVLID